MTANMCEEKRKWQTRNERLNMVAKLELVQGGLEFGITNINKKIKIKNKIVRVSIGVKLILIVVRDFN